MVQSMHYEKNYPNLVHLNEEGLGFNLSHNRKMEGCMLLQVYVMRGLITLQDKQTIQQLSNFGKKGNTYKALGNGNDDLVTPILCALYYLNSPYFYGNIDNEPLHKRNMTKEAFTGMDEIEEGTLKGILERFNDGDMQEHKPAMIFSNNRTVHNTNYEQYNTFVFN
jgi:hypothetical protein